MKFKVLEMKGIDSFFAFNAFHKLMFGLKMLPMYLGETYKEFFDRTELMSVDDQEKMIREAVMLVDLYRDEVLNLLKMVTDSNGVRFTEENIKNLSPWEIQEAAVAVCKEIVKSKPRVLTPAEKKN